MDKELLIAGIDPGLASGGFVLLQGGSKPEVLESISLIEKKGSAGKAKEEAEVLANNLNGWGDKKFMSAALRSSRWAFRVAEELDRLQKEYGEIDYFAIESFVDQPSKAHRERGGLLRDRWHTPLSMGSLAMVLHNRGITVEAGQIVYQNAGVVIRQWSSEIARLEKKESVVEGDKKVTNDHERKALVHALALNLRLNSATTDGKRAKVGVENE